MARNRKRARLSGGNRQPKRARKSRIDNKIVSRTSTRVNVTGPANLSERSLSARSRSLQVLSDLRRDPNLTFTQAAENRDVRTSTARKYISSALRRDSSGRVKARPNDRFGETLFIPSTKPDERIPIQSKSSKERKLVGAWHTALNAAARGDFSLIHKFPRGQMVGGVLLPTSPYHIQKILGAQAEAETKLEGPYRTLARPS
jgi:hypothetical protein